MYPSVSVWSCAGSWKITNTAVMNVHHTCPSHDHILEMCKYLADLTSHNPPVLETYEATSYTLIERRQFTNMVDLCQHVLFLASMQNQPPITDYVQRALEAWVLRGDPMPNQFIYETADMFASFGYRFRVTQRQISQIACEMMLDSAANRTIADVESPWDLLFSGVRIHEDYRLFTPWTLMPIPLPAVQPRANQRTDEHEQQVKKRIYQDYDCIVCPRCSFTCKNRKQFLLHDAEHWPEQSRVDLCSIISAWEDENTGREIRHLTQKGECMYFSTFAETSAIQMQQDMVMPDMASHFGHGQR